MANHIVAWRLPADTSAELERLHLSVNTLNEGTQQLPGGGYSTFRTFGPAGVLRLANHFARLEETARLAGNPVRLDPQRVRSALRQAIASYGDGEKRVRVILDLQQDTGSLYILVDRLQTPSAEDYRHGVRAVTRRMQRDNPKAKLTGFIGTAEQVRHELPPGINEAIMLSEDGEFLEGLSSNFFAVLNGQIWTAERGVLAGITRTLVLEAVGELQLPLRLEGARYGARNRIEEAFITSASRGILPVNSIDDRQVGSGDPGPLTGQLAGRYRAIVAAAVEQI